MNTLVTDKSVPLRRVALIGNPNVGKTTIFNQLTGMRQKVGNYPGVTVERKTGILSGTRPIKIIDLPGSYSLSPNSIDERIAYDVLTGHLDGEDPPDLVVCVVDASVLERNLYLVTQVIDLGLPVIVALNMMDAAKTTGLDIDVRLLEERLGVPVLPMVASEKKGIGKLIIEMRRSRLPALPDRHWSLLPSVDTEIQTLISKFAIEAQFVPENKRYIEVLQCLSNDVMLDFWNDKAPEFQKAVVAARERLSGMNVAYRQAEVIGRYAWISPLMNTVISRKKDPNAKTVSDKIDAVVTHRIVGPILFSLLLLLIFQAVFSWATPAMDLIESGVVGLGRLVRMQAPAGIVTDLVVDGIIAGVGNVVVFLPQILLLFFFLGLMEDTGYMARSAFIMDRIMSKVGLSGGSVVPLLSCFACAIPGIMAARTIANPKDRLITIMVAPLMSCSARLPIYTLFIAAFLPTGIVFGPITFQGLAMFSMYALGIVLAFVAAFVLKLVFKGQSSFFAMELPPYRMPRPRQIFWRMIDRSKAFVVRAGKIIFGMSVILWFLARFPGVASDPEIDAQRLAADGRFEVSVDSLISEGLSDTVAAELVSEEMVPVFRRINAAEAGHQVEHSFIGIIGHTLEPVMRPLGFDWKISAGLISAFAAREVMISALATIYSVGNGEEDSPLLRQQLKADRYPDGSPVYTPLVAVSLLVFFVIAMQCMSTLAITRRETNSWKWPAVMWLYMSGLAYLFSFIIYQGGRALGWG